MLPLDGELSSLRIFEARCLAGGKLRLPAQRRTLSSNANGRRHSKGCGHRRSAPNRRPGDEFPSSASIELPEAPGRNARLADPHPGVRTRGIRVRRAAGDTTHFLDGLRVALTWGDRTTRSDSTPSMCAVERATTPSSPCSTGPVPSTDVGRRDQKQFPEMTRALERTPWRVGIRFAPTISHVPGFARPRIHSIDAAIARCWPLDRRLIHPNLPRPRSPDPQLLPSDLDLTRTAMMTTINPFHRSM
jgi:hypothetical protein